MVSIGLFTRRFSRPRPDPATAIDLDVPTSVFSTRVTVTKGTSVDRVAVF